jgi:hypothetical protein
MKDLVAQMAPMMDAFRVSLVQTLGAGLEAGFATVADAITSTAPGGLAVTGNTAAGVAGLSVDWSSLEEAGLAEDPKSHLQGVTYVGNRPHRFGAVMVMSQDGVQKAVHSIDEGLVASLHRLSDGPLETQEYGGREYLTYIVPFAA